MNNVSTHLAAPAARPNRASAGKRRQMIYAPEINPRSFVFFFWKGDTERSWSIRDYSEPNRVSLRYAHEINSSLEDFWPKVRQNFDAPTHPTTDIAFWRRHTEELNRAHLGQLVGPPAGCHARLSTPAPNTRMVCGLFPILDPARFERHRKSRKPQDRERMLFSRNSEDWVTWTAFEFLERCAPDTWWPHLVGLAKAENPGLTLPTHWDKLPVIRLWQSTPAPRAYEQASRERMRLSGDPAWRLRSFDPKPVEGASEIDITLQNQVLTIFCEAKLRSDISLRTTYDPQRNQIIRNIDCVLEQMACRTPMFWMLVRDIDQHRSCVQILNHYRENPGVLIRELPHHNADSVAALARNLCIVAWRDLMSCVATASPEDDQERASVKRELWLRIGRSI